MTTHDQKPPQRGITRENTGVLFGHPWTGYYLTPEFHAEVMRRVEQRRGGDATTEAGPHLSTRAVHRDTAPTPQSKPKPVVKLDCPICGTTFVRTASKQRYCHPECRKVAIAAQQRRYRQSRQARPETQAKMTARNCVICDAPFNTIDRGAKTRTTCSSYCRSVRRLETQKANEDAA